MSYLNYLPKKAGVGQIKLNKMSGLVDGAVIDRYYSIGGIYSAYVNTGDCETGENWQPVDSGNLYNSATVYNDGDEVFTTHQLRFKCTTDGTVGIHPLSKNNKTEWVNNGYEFPYALGDGSADTFIGEPKGLQFDIFMQDIQIFDDDDYPFLFFGGVQASTAKVDIYGFSPFGTHILIDNFAVDMRYRDSLLVKTDNLDYPPNTFPYSIKVTFLPCVQGAAQNVIESTDRPVKIHNFCRGTFSELGVIQYNSGSTTGSIERLVISDEVDKTLFISGFNLVNGSLKVTEELYLKAKYILSKVSTNVSVFFAGSERETGTGSIFDQELTYGKLKYTSTSSIAGEHTFKINTESFSYSVSNPFVQPDSTNGAPA